MLLYLMCLVVASAVPPSVGQGDYQIVRDDLASLPPEVRFTTRYISLSEVEADDIEEAGRVVSFMLNSCAALRSGAIARPRFLAGGRIARFQVEWYAPAASDLESFLQEWERIAETNPYTCFQTEVLVDGDLQTVPVVGGWIPPALAREVSTLSGSICPVIHFGHFLASLESGDTYYRLTGVGDAADTLSKVGIDVAVVTALHADRAATVRHSAVANRKPRRIRVFAGAFGTAWVTYDVNRLAPNKDAIRHPLTNVVVDGAITTTLEFDANEYVIIGRNGLPVWLITTNNGKRQNVVPPEVAIDYSESYDTFDHQIRPPFGCIRCHAKNGFNEYTDYQQTLVQRGQFAYDPQAAARIAETYRDDLAQQRMRYDQEVINTSTKLACGVPWSDLSLMVSRMVRRYVYADVEPAEVARILNVDVNSLVADVTTDPYLLALAAGESINRAAWHSSAHLALLNGVQDDAKYHHSSNRFHVPGTTPEPSGVQPAASSEPASPEGAGPVSQPDSDSNASSSSRGNPRRGLRRGRL